jgi:peptidoglycan/LPS O-acetylase OafA/YrhL
VMLGAAIATALNLFEGMFFAIALLMWDGFFIGVIAYWAASRNHRGWILAMVGLGALMITLGTAGDAISALTAVGLFVAYRTDKLSTYLSWKPLQWLGTISYSLYLTHNELTGAVFGVSRKVLPKGVLSEFAALTLVIACCLVGAYVLWRVVERPSHAFSKRMDTRRRAVTPS